MNAEDFIVNYGCEGEVIEDFGAVAPHVDRAILFEALVVEAVNLGDLARLVISTNQSDSFWVAHFQGQKQQEGFDGVVASIHKIAHEKVVCVWTFASDLKKFHQIIKLTVNVTANLLLTRKEIGQNW